MDLRKIEKKYIVASVIVIGGAFMCLYTGSTMTNEDTSLTSQILTSITDSIKNLAPVKRAHQQYLDYLLAVKLFMSSIVIAITAGILTAIRDLWFSNNKLITYLILCIYVSALIVWGTGLFYTGLNFESFAKSISI